MNNLKVFHHTMKKELRILSRSNIYLMIIALDIVISLLIAIGEVYSLGAEKYLVFQVTLIRFFSLFFNYFIVLMIAPSLSISEEIENGTWDMMRVKIKDDTVPILAKFTFQLIFAFLLLLISAASFALIYFTHFGGFPSESVTTVSQTIRTEFWSANGVFPRITNTQQKVIIYYSIPKTFGVIALAFVVSAAIVSISTLFSKISKTRTIAIILSIGFFMTVSVIYPLLIAKQLNGIYNIYGQIAALNPHFLFSMIGSIFNYTKLNLVSSHLNVFIEVVNKRTSTFSYFIYYSFILIVSLLLVFMPNRGELFQWKRRIKS